MTDRLAGYLANYAHAERVDFDTAAMSAAMCAAQWATRVHLWPVGHPTRFAVRRRLPHDSRDAAQFIEALWRRLVAQIEGDAQLSQFSRVGALLLHGKQVVVDLHDGPACCLHIAPGRFSELQGCWKDEGLPSDIYVPEPLRTIASPAAPGATSI